MRLAEQIAEPRFIHRWLALVDGIDLPRIMIDADDRQTFGGEAGSERRTQFTQADDAGFDDHARASAVRHKCQPK